jgi:hypothetical protein
MFSIGKLLKGIIPPKMALSLLTTKICAELGHEVDRYILEMNTVTNKVKFIVEWPDRLGEPPERYKATGKHVYVLDSDDLINAFKVAVSVHIEPGTIIDVIFMDYDDNGQIKIVIGYRDKENNKLKKSIAL